MGNSIFSDEETLSPFFKTNSFQQIAQKCEPLYGEIKIMSSKLVPNYYIAYQSLFFSNKDDFFDKLKSFDHYKRNPHTNILTLLDFRVIEEEQSSCSCIGFIRVQMAYEYLTRTLAENFSLRCHDKESYKEEEIWRIIKSVLKGLNYVYENSEKSGIKFVNIEDLIVEGDQEIENVKLLNPFLIRNKYSNPHMMNFEETSQSFEIKIKKELYSLGKICLMLMTLDTTLENDGMNFDTQEYFEKIDKFLYSKNLRTYTCRLLDENSNYNLKMLLENLDKDEGKKENLTNNESFFWKGIDIPESNSNSVIRKPKIDNSNFEFHSPTKTYNKNGDGEFLLQPIMNFNYSSPIKTVSTKNENQFFIEKDKWDFKSQISKEEKPFSNEKENLWFEFPIKNDDNSIWGFKNSAKKEENQTWDNKENWEFKQYF